MCLDNVPDDDDNKNDDGDGGFDDEGAKGESHRPSQVCVPAEYP